MPNGAALQAEANRKAPEENRKEKAALAEGWQNVKSREQIERDMPTGYDASMRGTPATPVSIADAMKADQDKKKSMSPKQLKTAPMFEKRTK